MTKVKMFSCRDMYELELNINQFVDRTGATIISISTLSTVIIGSDKIFQALVLYSTREEI